MAKGKKAKKRKVKVDADGLVYIQATFNNIIISLCNRAGEVISWSSAGKSGFKGSKRILHMPHNFQRMMLPALLLKQECDLLKFL